MSNEPIAKSYKHKKKVVLSVKPDLEKSVPKLSQQTEMYIFMISKSWVGGKKDSLNKNLKHKFKLWKCMEGSKCLLCGYAWTPTAEWTYAGFGLETFPAKAN